MSEARIPAEIEARIARRRETLAETLGEIAVRVHPATIAGDARMRAAEALDRTAGRTYIAVNRAVGDVRAQFVTADGRPRPERVAPVALAAVAAVGLLVFTARRRR